MNKQQAEKELGRRLSFGEWDALCDGCGKCCRIRGCGYACPAFNVRTRRCMSYKTRLEDYLCLEVTPESIGPLHAKGILPDSCAYVRWAQKKPPLEHVEKATLLPLALAPLSIRRNVWRQTKAYRKKTGSKRK